MPILYYCHIRFRPHEVFNWLLSIDDRDYDVWDKGKVSWQIQYRRTNGPKDQIRINSYSLEHDDDENFDDDSFAKPRLENKVLSLRGHYKSRQKRGVEIISSNKEENVESLKLSESENAISEDSSVDNYEMFPEMDRDRYRLRAKLTIMKDDVQTVLPITKVKIDYL